MKLTDDGWSEHCRRMKTILRSAVCGLLIGLAGCALFSGWSPKRAHDLAYGIASIGTSDTLRLEPKYRPQFELAYTNLNNLIIHTNLSGANLREIILSLPFKKLQSPIGVIAVENGTFLYDVATGGTIGIETNAWFVSISTGVRDGLGAGLGYQ